MSYKILANKAMYMRRYRARKELEQLELSISQDLTFRGKTDIDKINRRELLIKKIEDNQPPRKEPLYVYE